MPFKQLRALIVRCSPRALKSQQLHVEAIAVQRLDPRVADLDRPSPLQQAPAAAAASTPDWVDEEAPSWNGDPPALPPSLFPTKRSSHQPSTPTPARSTPTPQGRFLRKKHLVDSTRLRVLNHELAEHLERAELDLSRKHVVISEMKEELSALWETARQDHTKRCELEEENARLSRLASLLATSKWRPTRQLKQRLLVLEARATLAEGQIATMKGFLADQAKERKDLREEAYELWDAILRTGEQAGALDRADRAMDRLSIRFDFEDTHI